MKVGDHKMLIPTFYCKAGLEHVPAQDAWVVYIHPKRRFCTVEFSANGKAWRESFFITRSRAENSSSRQHK